MPSLLRLVWPVGARVIRYYGWLREFSRHPETYPLEMRFHHTHAFAYSLIKPFRIRFIYRGLENTVGERALFVFNHQSDFDPPVIMAVLDTPVGFLAKKKIVTFPIINHIVNATDGDYLDRNDIRQELRTIKRIGKKMTQDPNMSYVIFPEGKRSQDPFDHTMSPYKPGAFKSAYLAKADIIPCALFGTYRCLEFNRADQCVYPIQISFLPRIRYEDYKGMSTVELAQHIEDLTRAEVARMRALQPSLEFYWNQPEHAREARWEMRHQAKLFERKRREQLAVERPLARQLRAKKPRSKPYVPCTYTRQDAANDRRAKAERKAERRRFIAEHEKAQKGER